MQRQIREVVFISDQGIFPVQSASLFAVYEWLFKKLKSKMFISVETAIKFSLIYRKTHCKRSVESKWSYHHLKEAKNDRWLLIYSDKLRPIGTSIWIYWWLEYLRKWKEKLSKGLCFNIKPTFQTETTTSEGVESRPKHNNYDREPP